MNVSRLEMNHNGAIKLHQILGYAVFGFLTMLLTLRAPGQAPTLLWSANVGATLFAVDAQTNVYANAGGAVIKLDANGVPLQTNTICPLPGFAQRDATGNYYFAGNFDGTQNFGGITLVGGWTNWPSPGRWTAGYPTHFVAKYDGAGVLQWVTSFGPQGQTENQITDVLLDGAGGIFIAHVRSGGLLTRLSATGQIVWSLGGDGGGDPLFLGNKLGGLTSSNFYALGFGGAGINAVRINFAGQNAGLPSAVFFPMSFTSPAVMNGKPVIDDLDRVFLAGKTNGQQVLRKYDPSNSLTWSRANTNGEQWSLARDAAGFVYFGTTNGGLIRYDTDGNQIWGATYNQTNVVGMLVDPSGNRFVRFANNTMARLGPDATPVPPQISTGPQIQIVGLGSNATFTVAATGSPTLTYLWRKDGVNLGAASTTNYTITGVSTNHVGAYDVVVTNLYGAITSAPAALLVSPSLLTPYSGAVGLWGQQATLSVAAWGSGALTYQWYKGGQLINGATNSTLVFPSVQINDGGAYGVVVTSAYGSVTNAPADLVVNPANVAIGLYAGITIEGTAGYTYGIEYATNLQNAVWQSVTNVTLTQPVEIWVDTSVEARNPPKRFYRVTNQ